MSTLTTDKHRSFHSLLRSLLERGADFDRVGEGENVKAAACSAPKLLPDAALMDIGIPGVSAIRRSNFFQRQAKFFVGLVCAFVLLPDGPLAEASSVAANFKVSARVVRSCGISPSPRAFRNSLSQAPDENSEIETGNGLKINCNTVSGGTMALSVGANMAGNAVIRVISNDKLGAESLKEAYLTHGRTNFPATMINLGLFPTAGTKVILIQSDNRAGSQVPIGTDERTMTLLIDF
jgi:spore coat protein U-like protein